MLRSLTMAILLGSVASGCGGPSEDYSQAASPSVFRDDAPANATITTADLPSNLVDHLGKPFNLADYRGKRNLVLVVTRGIPQSPGGVPCPYCVAQATSLTNQRSSFVAREAEVLFLFPGPSDQVGDFITASAPLKKSLPFPIALDRDLKVCDRLSIRGDWAKPSTFVLDKSGTVTYAYVGESRTDRPSAKAILAQLDRIQGVATKTNAPSTAPR